MTERLSTQEEKSYKRQDLATFRQKRAGKYWRQLCKLGNLSSYLSRVFWVVIICITAILILKTTISPPVFGEFQGLGTLGTQLTAADLGKPPFTSSSFTRRIDNQEYVLYSIQSTSHENSPFNPRPQSNPQMLCGLPVIMNILAHFLS